MPETQSESKCPACQQPVEAEFAFCPNCREMLGARCPNPLCGRVVLGDWRFCPHCSADLSGSGPTCEACGEGVSAAWRFCAGCGHRLFVACASCGGNVDQNWGFCVHCGRRLGELSDAVQRQRVLRGAEQMRDNQTRNEADRHNDRGAELLDEEQYEEAFEEFRQAYDLQPDSTFVSNMGLAQEGMGDLKEAQRCFDEAAGLDPYSPTPHLNLGYLHTDADRLEDAAACFRRAIKLGPDGAEGQEAQEALDNLKNL